MENINLETLQQKISQQEDGFNLLLSEIVEFKLENKPVIKYEFINTENPDSIRMILDDFIDDFENMKSSNEKIRHRWQNFFISMEMMFHYIDLVSNSILRLRIGYEKFLLWKLENQNKDVKEYKDDNQNSFDLTCKFRIKSKNYMNLVFEIRSWLHANYRLIAVCLLYDEELYHMELFLRNYFTKIKQSDCDFNVLVSDIFNHFKYPKKNDNLIIVNGFGNILSFEYKHWIAFFFHFYLHWKFCKNIPSHIQEWIQTGTVSKITRQWLEEFYFFGNRVSFTTFLEKRKSENC